MALVSCEVVLVCHAELTNQVLLITAISILDDFEASGRCVFRGRDLKKLLGDRSVSGFRATLGRLRAAERLHAAYRDVYVYMDGGAQKAHLHEAIAANLRRGEVCYVSLESALAEYGVISQSSGSSHRDDKRSIG